jgi:dTDP-4-amino-4,6-dideoxygalactose transaminase
VIKLLTPSIPPIESAQKYIRRAEEARHYTNFGQNVRELEERLSQRYGGAYVVTVSNCTIGLELVYTLRMIMGYRKIELPALTFAATWLAATRAGLEIVPIDVNKDTWIAPGVAGFGLPSFAPVVDAAGAFGEQSVPLLKGGMTAVFSGHATKTMGAGELGWCVTWDQGEADELRRMSNFHMESGISTGFGTNAKVSEYTAAVALASLDAYDREAWCQLHDWYAKHLPASVIAQKRPRGAYSLMPVKLPVRAIPAMDDLLKLGVETRQYYIPALHRHPLYEYRGNRAKRRKNPVNLPVTEDLEQHLTCLPWHLHLTESDVAEVCEKLAEVVGEVTTG